jgi:hypothetical protein
VGEFIRLKEQVCNIAYSEAQKGGWKIASEEGRSDTEVAGSTSSANSSVSRDRCAT